MPHVWLASTTCPDQYTRAQPNLMSIAICPPT